MITFKSGNILKSPCQTLVAHVSLSGIMNYGTELNMKIKYRKMYEHYRRHCLTGKLHLGEVLLYKGCPDRKWILSIPTREDFRKHSTIENIEKGLQRFIDTYKDLGITSIAFGKFGWEPGAIAWKTIKEKMIEMLSNLDIDVEVYEMGTIPKYKKLVYEEVSYGKPNHPISDENSAQ